MSLRLLQRSVTGTGQPTNAGSGGRGRGKPSGQRSGRTMSLRDFQQQAPGDPSASGKAPAQRSAWGPTPKAASSAGGAASSRGGAAARPTSWQRGPPSAVLDAAWAAPSASAADVDEAAWEEPAEGAGGWGGPEAGDWAAPAEGGWSAEQEADGWDAAPAEAWAAPAEEDGGGEEAGEPEAGEAGSGEEAALQTEVTAWLRELNLSEHRESVLQWCEEMGAASLDEVVDSAQDLAEALTLKPLQIRRLLKKAGDALEAVRGGGACPAQEGRGGAAKADDDAAADAAPQHAGGGSFYAASASTTGAPQPQSFYSSRGELPPDAKEEEEEEVEEEEDELGYLKQRPTERATWTPKSKVGQGARKKQQRQSSVAEVSGESQADAARQAEEAARRLERQLLEEDRRRGDEARAAIEEAAGSEDPEALRRAIREAQHSGLDAREIKDAEDLLTGTLRKLQQRRQRAVCALQAVLEGPRDEAFGSSVRSAIEAASDTQNVPGSAEALAAAEAALREWELQEKRRDEAKMALQLTIRRGEASALQAALEEARGAGLAESHLVAEAEQLLREVQAREKADAVAKERLCGAMDRRDLVALEEAVEACTARRLPLHGADSLLQALREEARLRTEASDRLCEATESEDANCIKAALEEARKAGVAASELEAAEARVAELEVALKRRENANVELYLARNARDARRLEAAIAEARRAGLSGEVLAEAEEELEEAREAEQRRAAACRALSEALERREAAPLSAAIEAAEAVLARGSREVSSARGVLLELEEEARHAEEARARAAVEARLQRALEAGDWDGIEAGREAAREMGFQEGSDILRRAAAALEELREAHELEEAQRMVAQAKARLAELQKREAELAGPTHKKERSAIGKEIMALRNNAEHLSAIRFLKDPEQERQRRVERAHEIERAATEERQRREKRQVEAAAELNVAMEHRDEDAVRALIVEGMLIRVDADAAATFLAELDQRREAADKDAMILEFCFAGLDRRDFFKASIAMNELFTDQYAMHEGADFKLKVVKASNSVLVAFRSREFASAVRRSATSLAAGSVVAGAEVRDAMAFSAEVEDSLPALRQDALGLQQKPPRPEAEAAVRAAAQGARGGSAASAGGKKPAEGSGTGQRLGSAWGPSLAGSRAATVGSLYPTTERPGAAAPAAAPGGRGIARGGTGPLSSEREGAGAYPGRGKGAGGGRGQGSPGNEDVIPLPRQAATMLQRDRATASTFHSDLKTFAGRFRVAAELRGLEAVVMRPMGMVHHEALRQARAELQGLLSYYFPERKEPARRWVKLRVDGTHGAGIEMTPSEHGYRVDHVEDFPGQDFAPGEIIVEVEGKPLAGLSDEAMEDTFGECFGDGASLCLIKGP